MSHSTHRRKSKSTPISFLCTLLGAAVLAAVVLSCAVLIIPGIMGYQSFVVITGSMEPTIPAGSVVFVQDVDSDSLEVGNVVTFYQNDSAIPVSHRIVELDKENRLIYTKGDVNEDIDFTPTSYDNIVGIVRFSIPGLGTIIQPLSSTSGKFAVAAAVIVGACLMELGSRLKKTNAVDDDDE